MTFEIEVNKQDGVIFEDTDDAVKFIQTIKDTDELVIWSDDELAYTRINNMFTGGLDTESHKTLPQSITKAIED